MNKECTHLVSSTGDYTAMDGRLLHNKLIVIAGHNYVLVNPQELNTTLADNSCNPYKPK